MQKEEKYTYKKSSNASIGGFVDIFADAKSIYPPCGFDIFASQIRYDLNPLSPRRAYRVLAHIERYAHIENPKRDLYRSN